MNNFIFAFLFTVLFSSSQLFGAVVHAPNLDVIEKHIENLDENALVVFDVDYTLIVPNDRILAPCGEAYLNRFVKKASTLGGKGKELESKVMLRMQVSLVEDRVLLLIEKLKQKKIKVITLTAISTGQYGVISNAEQWRVDQLASLGIHLDGSFPEIDSLTLEGFEGRSAPPVFKRGVLASAKHPKGRVLSAFLKKVQCTPSEVLFIDDKMEFIDSVESEMDKDHIKHTSFFYTAATDSSLQLDQKLADFQLSHLVKEGEWLNEQEAKNKMENIIVVEKPQMFVMGIECRTSNDPNAAPQDIPRLWAKFYSENIIDRIPNKASNEVIALYCDYESDHTQSYSCVIGCPVSSIGDLPEGMVAKTVPTSSYAVFSAIGEHPKSLIETWGKIWQTNLKRTFTGDFETYGDKFSSDPKEVEVSIAIYPIML